MLTDAECKAAKFPPDRNRLRLADFGGMYLEVSPSGKKNWFLKYRRPDGKEARMALGGYPYR